MRGINADTDGFKVEYSEIGNTQNPERGGQSRIYFDGEREHEIPALKSSMRSCPNRGCQHGHGQEKRSGCMDTGMDALRIGIAELVSRGLGSLEELAGG